ncbi:MAG: protein kinase [Planctomycetes bacterium]|nr:protein kinase [Planctomycetota bacterium]
MIGDRVSSERIGDRYGVQRKLGEGGMAEVFLVEDELEGRQVALKRLKDEQLNRDYFMHEFRLLSRLDHPNLVRVYDFGRERSGRSYYTCEVLDGEDLYRATQRMDFDDLYDVVAQILSALAFVHDRGLVHYDVKPENLNVKREDPERPGGRAAYRVKLMDFGLTGTATTQRGEKIKGTVHYVSPEVAKSLPADRRADLYSLGITLYYVITRKLPYDGGSALSIIRKHLERIPEPPTGLRPDLPEAWATFVLRLIEKDPQDRYPTAPAALEDLDRRLGKPEVARASAEGGVALTPRFVGREAEIARLEHFLPRGASSPPIVFLHGDEGVGKSRVLDELKVRAQLVGIPFLSARCVPGDEPPFARIMRLALTLPGGRALADQRQQELDAFGSGILVPDADISGEHAPPDEQRRVLDRVAELLLRLADKEPYVLVIEDVRFADEPTLALLAAVMRSYLDRRGMGPLPWILLVDREPELAYPADAALVEVITAGCLDRLKLAPLDRANAANMVASMLAVPELPEPLADKLFTATGGNPYFLEELVGSLLEDKVLQLRRSRVTPEQLAQIEPTRSLTDLVGKRLARLDHDTRRTLVALGVVDAPEGLDLLAEIAELPVERTLDALDTLLRRQLVERSEDPHDSRPRYAISHGAVQRAVLATIKPAALVGAHARALHAYEARHPGEIPGAALEPLARHAYRAGDLKRALRYAKAAGVRAAVAGDANRAVELLDRALELVRWEDVVEEEARCREEAEILTRLSEALSTAGRYKNARQVLEELLALGPEVLEPRAGVWVRRRLGDLALRQGNAAEARRWLRDALSAAEGASTDPGHQAERARVLEVMSRIMLWHGDYLRVISLAGEAEQIYRDLGRPSDALWAVEILCTAEYYRGRDRRAAELLGTCLELARQGQPDWRAALDAIGLDAADRDAFNAELASFDATRPLRREAGDAFGLVLTFSAVSTYFDLRAETGRALEFYRACLRSYERRGDAQRIALTCNNMGVLHRQAGDLGPAVGYLERALAIHEGTQDRQGGAVALMNLSLLLLYLGDWETAAARAQRALAVARELGITWLTGHCHRLLGRLHAERGELLDADRQLQRAAGVFRMISNERSLSDLLLERAEVACRAGEAEQAATLLARAGGVVGRGADFVARRSLVEGEVRLLEQQPGRAVSAFEEALRAAERAKIAELRLDALRGLALTFIRLRTPRSARQRWAEAEKLEQRMLLELDAPTRELWRRTPGSRRAREIERALDEALLE